MTKRAGRVLALSGGVGGARLIAGLAAVLPPSQLLAVVNTGDDFEHFGLHIAPDLDSVMYHLAGVESTASGWGIDGESWNFLEALERLGGETWFRLGDRDLATHIRRSSLLREGHSLAGATAALCRSFGLKTPLLPMSDDPVRTLICTAEGEMSFQDYFVRAGCAPQVSGFRFQGAEEARALPAFLDCLEGEKLQGVVICPSNPYVSIDPILSLPGIREALCRCQAPVAAVSPIIRGKALKGPAAKMMEELGVDPSAAAVAVRYRELLDGFLLDDADRDAAAAIREETGLVVRAVPSLMRSQAERAALARQVLDFFHELRS